MEDYRENIKQILSQLPSKPGVYQYFDENGTIIYVGKAKNLKRRVSSYFVNRRHNNKTRQLVAHIRNIKYIVVESEQDAFLLENNLIKQYQPHYNILLKDGKSYPSLCITKESYPRVFKTRNIDRKKGEYFGPYSFSNTVDLVLELIYQLYPIRTCKLLITDDTIEKKKHKVCLKYHLKKCCGICEGFDKDKYDDYIKDIRKIIVGDASVIAKGMEKEMQQLAAQMKYEQAQQIKERYLLIKKFESKTVITNTTKGNYLIYGYEEDRRCCYISYLKVHNGSITQGFVVEYQKKQDESKEEILSYAIDYINQKNSNNNDKDTNERIDGYIVPFLPTTKIEEQNYIIPQSGDKKKLLELAMMNAKQYRKDIQRTEDKKDPSNKNQRILESLQQSLRLEKFPHLIESFDNSNIQGTNAVASCVVFKDGTPDRSMYSKFEIKTVVGADDYASMREIAYRRYRRFSVDYSLEEDDSKDKRERELPDLILADGGLGQMNALKEVVNEQLGLDIPIAGMVKDNRHRTATLLYGDPALQVDINANDELFYFLTRIQDEVHRYAITYHKQKRSKSQIHSELDEIKGIGQKTKEVLINRFKSVKGIKQAEIGQLSEAIGKSKATIIYTHFHGNLGT